MGNKCELKMNRARRCKLRLEKGGTGLLDVASEARPPSTAEAAVDLMVEPLPAAALASPREVFLRSESRSLTLILELCRLYICG